VKILKFFDADPGSRIRDAKNSDPESRMEKKSDLGSGKISLIHNTVFKVHLYHFSKIKK